MAGRKLSARAADDVVFLEHILTELLHLKAKTEEYSASKKGDDILQGIIRALTHIRQNAMIKNLGPVADSAGMLGVAAGRGSQVQRSRVLREGLVGYEQLVDRTMKARIGADIRERAEAEKAAKGTTPATAGTGE